MNFFHSWLSFSLSLMVSFVVQMLLTSIRSHLFIFVFYVLILRGGSKKIFLHFMSKCVLLFSLKSSTESILLFRPLIYLQFIFVYGVRESSNFKLIFTLRKVPGVLHSGCSQFPFPHQCGRVPCALHPLQDLLFVEFPLMAIVTGVR